jgi:AcrR family transcriptional regulator
MTKKKEQPTSPPPQMGRRERRRIETREKLYRTAMELFAKRGFLETTTEDITDAADVGQGTFFNYFPTKSHVLLLLVEKQLGKVHEAVQEAQAGDVPSREVLHRFMYAIVEELAKSRALTQSLLTVFVSQLESRELMAITQVQGRHGVAKICAIGQQRGEIRNDRKPADLAMTFQRNVLGTLLIWSMQAKGDLHAWLENTFEDFWEIAAANRR